MSGTLVTLKDNRITHAEAVLEWPHPELYPRENWDGSITYFLPKPYYQFPLGTYLKIEGDFDHVQAF